MLCNNHFDGAVREYTPEQFASRLETTIDKFGRQSVYTKLWRTDSELSVSQWKRLLSDYYRDNVLIGEYLGATPEKVSRPHYNDNNQYLSSVEREYVPYTINSGDGIRMSISFHEKHSVRNPFQVIPLDYIGYEGDDKDFLIVEADTIELQKIFRRNGLALDIPDGVRTVYFQDCYANLPLILCSNESPSNEVRQVIGAIRDLVRAWIHRDYDIVAVYNIAYFIEDKEVRISTMGHIRDLDVWLSKDLAYPPTSKEQLFNWADRVADYLKTTFPERRNSPFIFDVLNQSTGMLHIEREFLPNSLYKHRRTDEGLITEFRQPDDKDLVEAMLTKKILPATALFDITSVCSRCKIAYLSCSCSKMLDDNVVEEITSISDLFYFWSNRPID